MKRIFLVLSILVVGAANAAELPKRPEDLKFDELRFALPDRQSLRIELDNSISVYVLPDHLLPLVRIEVLFMGGYYLDPPGKAGLASIAADAWRNGGAGRLTAAQFDARLDTIAAELTVRIDEVAGQITLEVLSENLEPAMDLLMDLLTDPGFSRQGLDQASANATLRMRSRNDLPAEVESRQWRRLLYGGDFWLNRLPTAASVSTISAADCRRFVASLIGAGNLVAAASGDIQPDAIRDLFQRTIGRLPPLERTVPEIPQPTHRPTAGVYLVDMPGNPQGLVRMGHIGYRIGHADEPALTVLNRILGGGDFSSRMVKRIRSDEGLAYAAWSEMTFGSTLPGHFAAAFESTPVDCARAARITVEIIGDLRSAGVTNDELDSAVQFLVDGFPSRFSTPAKIVGVYAADELLGRPDSYWEGYRARMGSVTALQVKGAAKRNLDIEHMVILVVGDVDRILLGHPDDESSFSDFGELAHLPLRDPMTLEPVAPAKSVSKVDARDR